MDKFDQRLLLPLFLSVVISVLYFLGSETKTADAQDRQCHLTMVTVWRIEVFDDQDTFGRSDPWIMSLFAYDDYARPHPAVGSGFGDVEYIEGFRIDGNHDATRENIGEFGCRFGVVCRPELPKRINMIAVIGLRAESGLNIFYQGFEHDAFDRDGVGIVSVRHDPLLNFYGSFTETSNTGGYRIDYSIDCLNYVPFANAGPPYTGIRGFPVSFDGSLSSDPDGNIVSYEWDFGDGTTGSGIRPIHTYDRAGTFEVILRVTDRYNAISTSSTTVTIQPEASTDFTVNCQQNVITIFAGGENRQTQCTVASLHGFAQAVDLSCESPTNPYITCSFSPSQVTPPANGSIDSTLTVGAGYQSPFGTHDLKITAASGGTTFTITMRAEVLPI